MNQAEKTRATHLSRPAGQERRAFVVGLLNNMSDGALVATEEQFCSLLQESAPPGVDLTIRYYSLPGLERGDAARGHMQGRYEPVERLAKAHLDALIVTGAEPRAAKLEEEAYWPSLARVVDWSEAEGIPTAWSCLAAHAAVQRLSGVRRRRLPAKYSGVFPLQITGGGLLARNAPNEMVAPHSRLNDLDAHELEDAGYEIVARSPDVGVDTFVRRGPALTVFFQGHPEYDADALGREYLRDVSRFLRGHQTNHPPAPTGYFDPVTLGVLQALSDRAESTRAAGLLEAYAQAVGTRAPRGAWRPWALHVYRAWLRHASAVSVAGPAGATTER